MTEATAEAQATTFLDNLNQLRDAAQQVSSMKEPDIDILTDVVAKGTKAYKACMTRIEEVEKALGLNDEADADDADETEEDGE